MNAEKKIKETALKLFSERGYRGASMREIAERAGITKPAIYYYFKDKEDLFETTIKSELSELINAVEEKISSGRNLEEKILGFAKAYLEYFKSRRDIGNAILRELLGLVEERKLTFKDPFKIIIQKTEDLFGEAKGVLSEQEIENLAFSLIGYLNMVILGSYTLKKNWSVKEINNTLKTFFLPFFQHKLT